MDPATISALAYAGTAATVGGVQATASGKMNRRTRKLAREQFDKSLEENERNRQYNADQARLGRQFAVDYYERFQSPEAMARQYREAGLNPYASVGAQSSFNSAAASQTAPVDIASMSAPYMQYANAVGQSYQNQSQEQMQAINNGFSGAVAAANQYLDLQRKQLENEQLEKNLSRLGSDLDVFNQPLSPDMIELFPGLEPILQRSQSVGSTSKGGRGVAELPNMTVGQALALFQYLRPVADFNTSPSGWLPTSDGDAFMRQYYKAVARNHGHEYYKSFDGPVSENRAQAYKTEYGPLLAAFDAAHGTNLSNISSQEFSRWSNDWNKRLMKLGISPNGNSFADTAARLLGYNMGENGTRAITNLMTSLGDALALPANFLDSLIRWNNRNLRK